MVYVLQWFLMRTREEAQFAVVWAWLGRGFEVGQWSRSGVRCDGSMVVKCDARVVGACARGFGGLQFLGHGSGFLCSCYWFCGNRDESLKVLSGEEGSRV